MPVPEVKKSDTKRKYIKRCIRTLQRADPDRSNEQIAVICYTKWRNRNKSDAAENSGII